MAESAAVLFLVVLVTTWFAAWPSGLPPAVPLLGLAGVGIACLRGAVARPVPRPAAETVACATLAVLFRLQALLHPWGWVNRDGAYGAFIALHLLEGMRPAPIFTEGANYQGSLKGHVSALVALVTGSRDLSWLMTVSSVLLYVLFLAASMALARRLGGRFAAVATGLYLALSPKFLTTFSLNCVGQYVDVLALGGVALALLARVLDEEQTGTAARGPYLSIGLLLGAAFWQQPVALCYIGAALLALAARRATWRDPWTLLVLAGLAIGALPVLLWNLQNDWASSGILGRDPAELRGQVGALPAQVAQTFTVSFSILAGLSPGHPWGALPGLRTAALLLLPLALAGYLARKGRPIAEGVLRLRPPAAVLPVLLMAVCLALFWFTASGSIHRRPRYLLPVLAASSVHLGVAGAGLWRSSRAAATVLLAVVLAFGVAGSWPRLRESAAIAEWHRGVVRSLEEKGIRTGYSDFSIAAPVTMFTAERITISARLGPTPAYYSDRQEERVRREGPDAYILVPADDPEAFASVLRGLGVSYAFDPRPVPVFHAFSRRVAPEEVAGFRGDGSAEVPPEE